MPVSLLVGPANAGKVATLLDRYVAALGSDPCLVVPNRGEIERIERDLLRRVPALLGGWIGTFDDLFERIVRGEHARPVVSRLGRGLLLGRALARTPLRALAASARSPGFAEAAGDALAELGGALVDPGEVEGELGALYRAYVEELGASGCWDREELRRAALRRLEGELAAWEGSPVFVYGFEDLSGAQWALVRALAGRAEVTVSLPYEPGRLAFEALRRTAEDLASLAGGAVEELPAQPWYESPALAELERRLFAEAPAGEGVPLDGGVRFFEAAGPRGALELVGEEILSLLRGGVPAEEIALLAPSLEPLRAPLETAFGALGIPYLVEARSRLGRTPFGRALLGLLRFAWLGGGRRDLFAFLRSPYSGIARSRADFVEGRLRGRGVSEPERVAEEAARLLGQPLVALDALCGAADPLAATADLARAMLRTAWGLERPPVEEAARLDLRAEQAAREVLDELAGWRGRGVAVGVDDVARALDQAPVGARSAEPGRVAVLDLLEARTRRFDYVFLLGLQEGTLPRRAVEAPFLPDEERRRLEEHGRAERLLRPDALARDRYLFYTACTRARRRLTLVREAATEDGRPLEASPFWEEVRSLFAPDDVRRATRRRALSALTWELERAPSERERLRAVAVLAAGDETLARALAAGAGWQRRLDRAVAAFQRPTRLVNPLVLAQLRETTRYAATELERFLDCSSMWLVERLIDPREIDRAIDARLRGTVAHQALYRFFGGIPRRFGTDTVDPGRLDEAVEYLHECLDEAVAAHVPAELPELDRLELRGGLARDLELFLRREVELGLPLVPRRLEVAFGSERAAPELQRGLDLGGFTVTGKIDRIDVDPFSARGIVQDYKSGEAFSAARIASGGRLQIPLYVLALRDLVGIEPLGGLYRSLSGEREARGLLRAQARAELEGLPPRDFLDEDEFWAQIDAAVERARGAVERMRAGDVRHDPKGGECPSWCDLWPMCRVRRA